MKNKGTIKKAIATTSLITMCLSMTACGVNNSEAKMLAYSDVVKTAMQDVSDKESTETYHKVFEDSKFYDTLVKEFKQVEGLSIEEEDDYIKFTTYVNSRNLLEDEKFYKEELSDLIKAINDASNKKVKFNIIINYQVAENSVKLPNYDEYIAYINKEDKTINVVKNRNFDILHNINEIHYKYDVKKGDFIEISKEQAYDEIDKFYKNESLNNVDSFNVKKVTHFEKDSVKSSFSLDLDKDYEKNKPEELIDGLAEQVSSDNNIDTVVVSVKSNKGYTKTHMAKIDKTGKVVEYDIKK